MEVIGETITYMENLERVSQKTAKKHIKTLLKNKDVKMEFHHKPKES